MNQMYIGTALKVGCASHAPLFGSSWPWFRVAATPGACGMAAWGPTMSRTSMSMVTVIGALKFGDACSASFQHVGAEEPTARAVCAVQSPLLVPHTSNAVALEPTNPDTSTLNRRIMPLTQSSW